MKICETVAETPVQPVRIITTTNMTFPVVPRRSSTLILAIHSQLANRTASSVGYKLLMLQRSSVSKFMPNTYVFPGGVSETSDFSSEWFELLGNRGLTLKTSMCNSSFYKSYTSSTQNSLPAHIGFRICAIRETFEESGVLLVKPLPGNKRADSQSAGNVQIDSGEINKWRKRVHDDASVFLQFCREIHCAPDIWSLYEWSNWITPGNSLHRYDTIFYFASLDTEPEMSHDDKEVTNSLWIHPDEAVILRLRNKFNIAPPQFYEMSRLCRFTNIEELKTFVQSIEGVEAWEAVRVNTKNGDQVVFFPGDYMYEKMKNETHEYYKSFTAKAKLKDLMKIPLMTISKTKEELYIKDENMNRILVNIRTRQFKIDCNVTLKYNMPLPLDKFNIFREYFAKL